MCPNPASLKSPVAPLGRKRTRNHDLPPRMARKGAHYYYVCNKPRRWIPLGIDLAAAKRKWAELEQGPAQGLTVGELVQRYIDTHGHELAAGTVKQYRSFHRAIVLSFPIPANQLTPVHVALWRDLPDQRRRRTYVNGCLAVLRAACAMGAEQGLSSDLRVRGNRLKPRDRYLTDDEYRAIREKAPEWLQIAMDLGYLTAARRSDVLAFTWADVDSTLSMRQMKTKQRMSFEITPELSAILGEARKRRVLGLHIVANSRGRPIHPSLFGRAWLAACKAAGVTAQFRDIRAKAATDAKSGGQDYQKLLGHANPAMSERYIKRRETVIAEPVRRKL